MARGLTMAVLGQLGAAAVLFLGASAGRAQFTEILQTNANASACEPCPVVCESGGLWDRTFGRRKAQNACIPGYDCAPAATGGQTGMDPRPSQDPSFADLGSGAGIGSGLALRDPGGYLDPATVRTTFRLRFESAYNNNVPDRAEYFYGKCGCFRFLPPTSPAFDPNAPGPSLIERRIDYQDIRAYFEYAFSCRFSAFVEAPVRFLNPQVNDNTAGFADMNVGMKYAIIADASRYLTAQLRVYIPTGDADRGLGTNHVSIEPGLLFTQALGNRWTLQGQVRDWIAIGGTDFAGNVLDYGLGLSFLALQTDQVRVSPVVEAAGWSVLSGKELLNDAVKDAAGDTIANGKIGLRIGLGQLTENCTERNDIYIGYGRALTGTVWYKDLIRVEYRRFW